MIAAVPVTSDRTTTSCRAWILRRKDGIALGFTDHDRDLVLEDVTCRASSGLVAYAIERTTGLAVDNGEVSGALSADGLSVEDIRAGRWDAASVVTYRVDWAAPEDRTIVFRGALGEITEGDGRFSVELRSPADLLNVVRGRVFHRRCDAVLGDRRCGVDLEGRGLSMEATLVETDDGGHVLAFAADEVSLAGGSLVGGRCRLLDGVAIGLGGRIRSDARRGALRVVALAIAPRIAPSVGDRVRIEVGCDKTMATCRDVFDNMLNFRGFPHLPGNDWRVASPVAETRP